MQTVCHLAMLPHEQAKKYGDRTVFEYKEFGGTEWKKVSWTEFSDAVKKVSNALLNLGVKVQENIGVFSQNTLPYFYADFGAFGVRAVTIPFYATSSEQQLQYVINDAQIRVMFVGEQEQYDKARRVQALCPTLERIIVFDETVTFADHDVTSLHFGDFMKLAEGLPVERAEQYRHCEHTIHFGHYGRIEGCGADLRTVCSSVQGEQRVCACGGGGQGDHLPAYCPHI